MRTTKPVRIAHAYGNARRAIDLAMHADVDMLEADIWYRRGRVYVHHDRHLAPLPLLADRRMRGHPRPPWALPLPRGYYVRPDVHILTIEDLLRLTANGRRLLLDVKGKDDAAHARRFARRLSSAVREYDAAGSVEVCGQTWPVLIELRTLAPEINVRFSIERPDQWQAFVAMAGHEERAPNVCVEHRFLTDDRLRFLKDRGAGIYTWTVDRQAEAEALLDRGVDGIISNNLALLAMLGSAPNP